MQSHLMSNRRLDSYLILISSKYFKSEEDFINIVCVNSKFKETTEKLRFNPIPISSLTLFPKIQTQYLYSEDDMKIRGIDNYEICYEVTYDQYLKYKQDNIKYHNIIYTHDNRKSHGEIIPLTINVLGDYCFGSKNVYISESNIKEIIIPSTIKSLNKGCFSCCDQLTSINLPSTITSLGDYCFQICKSLKSINFPYILQSIGNSCFVGCSSLTSINLPSSITSIGNNCFNNCISLQFVSLPSTIKTLMFYCFYRCSALSSIELPLSLTSIDKGCFSDCTSLTSINLPSSLTKLGKGCFHGCSQIQQLINVPTRCFNL